MALLSKMTPEPHKPKITVWLVEDHNDFRRTIHRVINQLEGMTCPRIFSNCEELLQALKTETAPQVVLSDVGLPGMSGIAGVSKIKALSPHTHVVMLTVYDDHEKVFDAICAGASGYLLKSASEETITNAIQEVMAGGAPMNPRVAKKVLEVFARIAPKKKQDYDLSDREQEVLLLMSQGLVKKEIADKLSLSYHTVSNHLRSIYGKLHVHSHSGAVAKALRERLF